MAFKFISQDWKTPNTYSCNFAEPPKRSGVYLLTFVDFKTQKYDILYVGSSKNLNNRYSTHSKITELQKIYHYIQFYFKEVDNYIEVEKQLIKEIQPKYNKQWL